MPVEPVSFLLLVLLGGVVAIDGTSVGQFMLSRPFVAATLAGAIVGQPAQGALIGLVLEAFHLAVLPVGAAKYPEGGPAAVSAGAVYASTAPGPSGLVLVVSAVLLLEWVGGESVRLMRQGNVKLVAAESGRPIDPSRLERRHLAAIFCDYARGMLLVAGGILLLSGVLRFLSPYWGLGERIPQAVVGAVVAGLLASSLRIVGTHGWLAAVGAVAGLAFLLLA